MLEVAAALDLILQLARPRAPLSLDPNDALGRTLAEDVASDIDSPPHDKAMVDGYAVVASDLTGEPTELNVLEQVTAGEMPSQTVVSGKAIRIMTGAPLPAGADAVVMVERCTVTPALEAAGKVRFENYTAKPGENITLAGTNLRAGETVLYSGVELRPIEIGLLVEIGRAQALCYPAPQVAVLATGNELVPAGETPGPGCIRNSNSPMLCALARKQGANVVDLGIARDDQYSLAEAIARGLEADVLVISGGVSAGVLDLVPSLLKQAGVREVFHKVNLKPGKPLWFGVKPNAAGDKLVFGLPGNPVSSLVCFELFVRPALAELSGQHAVGMERRTARLAREHQHKSDRPAYVPAVLRGDPSAPSVDILHWHGSADLRTLADADCLAVLKPGNYLLPAGEVVEVVVF